MPREVKSIKEILLEKNFSKGRFNRHEFQAYGNTLAEELSDASHRSLYIKYAKTLDRKVLEKAREYAKAADKLKSGGKARIFMWKLKQIKEGITS